MDIILNDKPKFIKISPIDKVNSTIIIGKPFRQKLRGLYIKGFVSKKELYKFISLIGSQCPKFYRLPKTHKECILCRPILDTLNSVQYR